MIPLWKKLEKIPSNFTQHFNFEYIDLITFNNLPVIPHLTKRNHNFICETLSKAFL